MPTLTFTTARPRTVADLMYTDVVTVAPTATVRELARLLWRNAISGAPVVSDGKVVGLVSSTDVLWLADRMEGDPAHSFFDWTGLDRYMVADIMTPDVFGVAPTAGLEELRAFFVRTGVHRAPVLEGGRLVGIVSLTDVLGIVAREGTPVTEGQEP